ncbi:MAG: Ig-like domain-containing protein [Nitrospirae bacterium]|nr:Ig-like domain-containing protein [Nitrospirota bacterium]
MKNHLPNFGVVLIALGIILAYSCDSSPVSGFTITEPKPGTIYHPGDRVTLRVVTDPNEQPVAVYLYATNMQYSDLYSAPPYELTFTIPADFTGKDILVASERFSDDKIIETQVEITVILPTNITLQGINASPTFILLQKMPSGSDPNDVRAYETDSLAVSGTYSDGVKREITASASGTTYTSSNEKVVTVSPDGKVTAQGLGNATITVRNGKYSATVKIVVKPYK